MCILFTCSVDATHSQRLGKFINDSNHPNAKMKSVVVDDVPKLCLFAITDIKKNWEIRYDYDAPNLWWRRHCVSR